MKPDDSILSNTPTIFMQITVDFNLTIRIYAINLVFIFVYHDFCPYNANGGDGVTRHPAQANNPQRGQQLRDCRVDHLSERQAANSTAVTADRGIQTTFADSDVFDFTAVPLKDIAATMFGILTR
tara:strand:- start:8663 stop:9037 length:375 start_codon:yes stop_codon:yes gene_type:complete